MENIAAKGANTAQVEPVSVEVRYAHESLFREQRSSVAFDEHASKAESIFWNGQLESARTGLKRLTEKVYSLSGNKNLQGVERVKFLCDLHALSSSTTTA